MRNYCRRWICLVWSIRKNTSCCLFRMILNRRKMSSFCDCGHGRLRKSGFASDWCRFLVWGWKPKGDSFWKGIARLCWRRCLRYWICSFRWWRHRYWPLVLFWTNIFIVVIWLIVRCWVGSWWFLRRWRRQGFTLDVVCRWYKRYSGYYLFYDGWWWWSWEDSCPLQFGIYCFFGVI